MAMDPHGVPQKINRHVFKAIKFYMSHKNGSSFPEIYNFVKFCNKNLTPVSNLKETVRKSLNNLHRVGLVQKDRMKFKTRPGIVAKKTKKKTESPSSETKESSSQPQSAQKAKKRKNSDSSLNSETEGNATKRLRGGKKKEVEDRKGKKVDLPRARRHQGGGGPGAPMNFAAMSTTDSKVNLAGRDSDEPKTPRGISINDEKMDTDMDDQSSGPGFRAPSESSLANPSANDNPFGNATEPFCPCPEQNNNTTDA